MPLSPIVEPRELQHLPIMTSTCTVTVKALVATTVVLCAVLAPVRLDAARTSPAWVKGVALGSYRGGSLNGVVDANGATKQGGRTTAVVAVPSMVATSSVAKARRKQNVAG